MVRSSVAMIDQLGRAFQAAVGMAGKDHRTVLNVDDPLHRGDVVVARGQRHLRDRDGEAFGGQPVIDPAPGAAVDIRAMHQNDVLHIGLRRVRVRGQGREGHGPGEEESVKMGHSEVFILLSRSILRRAGFRPAWKSSARSGPAIICTVPAGTRSLRRLRRWSTSSAPGGETCARHAPSCRLCLMFVASLLGGWPNNFR